jgi:hypothetical protein
MIPVHPKAVEIDHACYFFATKHPKLFLEKGLLQACNQDNDDEGYTWKFYLILKTNKLTTGEYLAEQRTSILIRISIIIAGVDYG